MKTKRFLVDTSALIRLGRNDELRRSWRREIDSGLLGVCSSTELELFFSARSAADRKAIQSELNKTFTWVVTPEKVFERAHEIQKALHSRGTHRSAGPVDLLVSATAQLQGLALLHYDRDFDTVASTTGQDVPWVAEPGSVD
ncbi:PIN domain nuclease [Actinoplanes sp. NPDC051494]|uniref:PIN domain nuclease n=1 Tax=Actinoplanes sp. NPDC051494 TaxID=3363907 RepID=UPI0037B0346C